MTRAKQPLPPMPKISELNTDQATPAQEEVCELLSTILLHIADRNSVLDLDEEAILSNPFHCTCPPSIPLPDYLQRMNKYMHCSYEAYVLASIYITRLEAQGVMKSLITNLSVHRLVLASCIVAAKYHDDIFLDNKHYAAVGGVELEEVNKLEIALVTGLNFDLHVTSEQYDVCLQSLTTIANLVRPILNNNNNTTATSTTTAPPSAPTHRRSSSAFSRRRSSKPVMPAILEDSPAAKCQAVATTVATEVPSSPGMKVDTVLGKSTSSTSISKKITKPTHRRTVSAMVGTCSAAVKRFSVAGRPRIGSIE